MEFLRDVFVKFWKEVIVAALLTAVLPIVQMYVRRQRAKMINFFKEKKRLEQSVIELEEKLRASQEEAERLRAELDQERKAREESERSNQEFQREIESLRDELTREQEAHEESERLLNAAKEAERFRAEEWRKAQNEADSLRRELERLKSEPKPEPKETIPNLEEECELAKRYHATREYKQALEHYLIAAEHGHVRAQYILGNMHYYGDGVKQDKSEAAKWYRKAAAQGDAEARFMLKYVCQ